MAVNVLADLEGVGGSVHWVDLNHPQPATNGKGRGGGVSRHTSRRPRQGTRPSASCPIYLRTAAAWQRPRSHVLAETNQRTHRATVRREYHAFVCKNASLSPDIFTAPPQSAKLSSFVPQLI